jgi:hypothetical protein
MCKYYLEQHLKLFVAHPKYEYTHKTKYVKISKIKQQDRQGLTSGSLYLNGGLLARIQLATGRSCDQPTRSRFSVVFLGPRANAVLVRKFHVALHASHAALAILTSKSRPPSDIYFDLMQPFQR